MANAEPNEAVYCVRISLGLFRDKDCSTAFNFVCKRPTGYHNSTYDYIVEANYTLHRTYTGACISARSLVAFHIMSYILASIYLKCTYNYVNSFVINQYNKILKNA